VELLGPRFDGGVGDEWVCFYLLAFQGYRRRTSIQDIIVER
jgi:hypothetical protein